MHRIAGEEHPASAVAVGEQQILPPRIAGQPLVLHRNADGVLELAIHLRLGLDHRMQRPVVGGVLHDQLRGLVVGDVIVPALAGAVAERQPLEQLFAMVKRLAQAQADCLRRSA